MIAGEPVVATLASIPARQAALGLVVASLLPQVDALGVYLNGYPDVPAFLDDPRVTVARSQDHGDRGDAGKFFWADQPPAGYRLTCDDDIIYPADYADRMVAAVDRYARAALVSLTGAVLQQPVADAHDRRVTSSHCLHDQPGDRAAHLVGSGVLAYHTSTVDLHPDDFQVPNMADWWLSAKAQAARVPLVTLAHTAGWLQYATPDNEDTIWAHTSRRTGSAKDTRQAQTDLARTVDWKLTAPPRTRIVVSVLAYNRPDSLRLLLDDLDRERARFDCDLRVRVYDDHSPLHEQTQAMVEARGHTWIRAGHNHGKHEHWRWISAELADLRGVYADYYISIGDDMLLEPHFFARALDVWEGLADPAVLNLAVHASRPGPCWTAQQPEPARKAVKVGWTDGLYLARRELLERLDFHVNEPGVNFRARPLVGSGVGGEVSKRLVLQGVSLYRVERSLVTMQEVPSLMNPQVRGDAPQTALDPVGELADDAGLYEVEGPTGTAVIAGRQDDHISKAFAGGGYYERDLLDAIRAHGLRGVYVDVGAHVGNHTAYFAIECPASRVVAVEPNLESYVLLRTTVEHNNLAGRVDCIRAAVHPVWTSATVVPGPAGNTGMASVREGGLCPVARLDELLWDLGTVAVLKIDVEGLGAAALETARHVIGRDRPLVAVEARDGGEAKETAAVLTPLGYRCSTRSYGRTPVFIWTPQAATRKKRSV